MGNERDRRKCSLQSYFSSSFASFSAFFILLLSPVNEIEIHRAARGASRNNSPLWISREGIISLSGRRGEKMIARRHKLASAVRSSILFASEYRRARLPEEASREQLMAEANIMRPQNSSSPVYSSRVTDSHGTQPSLFSPFSESPFRPRDELINDSQSS